MIRRAALAAFFLASAAILGAGELAPGLAYLRTTDPQAVATALATSSVVLDLRGVTEPVAPVRIPRNRTLLILVSPGATPPAFAGALTVGRAAPDHKTDITVTTTAEAEDKALAALAAGEAPENLIVENATKPRYDESLLLREHRTAEPIDLDENPPAAADAKPSADAPPPVFDAVLQRAVHVYRGLVALKKIPAP